MKEVHEYIERVQTGKRNAGQKEKLAVQRFLDFCDHPDYYFDEREVETVFKISKLFIHTSGDYQGKPFTLLPWQKFGIAHIFGLKKRKDGLRLTRKAYFGIAKKNGKTEYAGFLGTYFTFFGGEKGGEIYSAANKYDQACFSWNAGAYMFAHLCNKSEYLRENSKVYNSKNAKELRNLAEDADGLPNNSVFKPIASSKSSSKTLDGVKASVAIIDEFHAAESDDIINNLSSAMVNRSQPLLIIITTAGFNINGPCHIYEKVCFDILKGTKKDDSTFPLMFQDDEGDDWEDEKTWEKSNPSIGVTPTWVGLRSEYIEAINVGASVEVGFKTKNLNRWVRASKVWIQDKIWQQGQTKWTLDGMKGQKCYMAIDLSSNKDITCIGLLFPPTDSRKQFRFFLESFIPEVNSRKRSVKDQVPYEEWEEDGWIKYTRGDFIDYPTIEDRIQELLGFVNVLGVSYDKWQCESTAQRLIAAGLKDSIIQEFAQTTRMFNEPIKLIEKLVSKFQVDYGGNQALRWMAGNVVLYFDNNELMKFDRKLSREKIDGMVVLGMCFGEHLDAIRGEQKKPYQDRGVRYL